MKKILLFLPMLLIFITGRAQNTDSQRSGINSTSLEGKSFKVTLTSNMSESSDYKQSNATGTRSNKNSTGSESGTGSGTNMSGTGTSGTGTSGTQTPGSGTTGTSGSGTVGSGSTETTGTGTTGSGTTSGGTIGTNRTDQTGTGNTTTEQTGSSQGTRIDNTGNQAGQSSNKAGQSAQSGSRTDNSNRVNTDMNTMNISNRDNEKVILRFENGRINTSFMVNQDKCPYSVTASDTKEISFDANCNSGTISNNSTSTTTTSNNSNASTYRWTGKVNGKNIEGTLMMTSMNGQSMTYTFKGSETKEKDASKQIGER